MKKSQVTLLDRARADLGTAKIMLQQLDADEMYVDIVAYHYPLSPPKPLLYAVQ